MIGLHELKDEILIEHIAYRAQTLASLHNAIEKTERELRELKDERARRAAYLAAHANDESGAGDE